MQQTRQRGENLAGGVLSLAVSPNFAKDGLCLAATNQGLWRTVDAGGTWQSVFDAPTAGESTPSVTAVTISPDFAQNQTILAGLLGGVLVSRDQGFSWETTFQRNPPPLVTDIRFHVAPQHGQIVLVGTLGDGVYLSYDLDKGLERQWHAGNFGLIDQNVLCLASSRRNSQVYLGAESGLFQSHNGGRTWRETDFPHHLAPVLALEAMGTKTGETIWAGTETHGIWMSEDQGVSWGQTGGDQINAPINALHCLDERNQIMLAATGQSLFYTENKGANWTQVHSNDLPSTNIMAVTTFQESAGVNEWVVFLGLDNGKVLRCFLKQGANAGPMFTIVV